MNSSYIYLLIFACIGYLIITDESIARAITLSFQVVKFQFDKTKWVIMNDPRNPIVKYFMWKRAYKLAEELQKELEDKSK
jgi:predicted transcriptional regulator